MPTVENDFFELRIKLLQLTRLITGHRITNVVVFPH